MDVVSVLAQKGGVGKITLTLHWAVEAERLNRLRVAVIDMDAQGSAAAWAKRRLDKQHTETPALLRADVKSLPKVLKLCEAERMDLALIDTMPRIEETSVTAARLADMSIIPCGPSAIDIEAIGATIDILAGARKPGVIVLNQGRPRSKINQKAVEVLFQYQVPVCPVQIMRRAALMDAFTDGRSVAEVEPKGKGAREIGRSCKWIFKQLEQGK